jgi:hypothetical protein
MPGAVAAGQIDRGGLLPAPRSSSGGVLEVEAVALEATTHSSSSGAGQIAGSGFFARAQVVLPRGHCRWRRAKLTAVSGADHNIDRSFGQGRASHAAPPRSRGGLRSAVPPLCRGRAAMVDQQGGRPEVAERGHARRASGLSVGRAVESVCGGAGQPAVGRSRGVVGWDGGRREEETWSENDT